MSSRRSNDKTTFENLYIHVPFCNSKCDYCAFYSEGKDHSAMEAYTEKILAQLDENASALSGISTIYIGGGTPVVLKTDQLEKLLNRCKKLSSGLREFSIECNPESLDEEKASLLGEYVTRVSVGIQSFQEHLRTRIGRRGTLSAVGKAFENLHREKIKHLNCDLIYALPGQTAEELKDDLVRALDLGIDHLSAYALILEEDSLLHKRFDPGETFLNDHAAVLEETVLKPFMETTALKRYEISNYAKEKCICLHNENIWHGGTYLGLGPAACSFDGIDRYTCVPSVSRWLAGEEAQYDRIDRRTRLGEIFFMGLRTVRGWAEGEFQSRTSSEIPGSFYENFAQLRKDGLMHENALSLTEKGLDYWNDAAELFI